MDDLNFNDDRNLKISFLKKLGIIIVVFIVVFLIVRGCNNFLSNKISEDINKDKITKIESETKEEIDLSKPFSYYNITTNEELHNFLRLIGDYLIPKNLTEYIDYENQTGFSINGYNWEAYNNSYKILELLKDIAYENVIEKLKNNNVDYDKAPITDDFKNKLIQGFFNEFKSFVLTHYNYKKKNFVLTKHNEEAQDDYYFNFSLDEDGYLDDIALEKIVPMYDEKGIYIPKKDSILMNNIENVELIISQVVLSEDSYYSEGDWEYDEKKSPQSRYNRFKEFGLTDRFREYYASLNEKGIIEEEIDSDEGDTIEIIDINIKNQTAVVKIVFHTLNIIKYYDVSWSTDDEYRLDTINVKFNREEPK